MTDQSSFDFVDKMADVRAKLSKQMFALGVEMLVAQGLQEPSARAFLGKRLKEIGKEHLLRVIFAAAVGEVADPRTYIAGAGRKKREEEAESSGDDGGGIQGWME